MDPKTLFERRAQQSEATRRSNLDKAKNILLNHGKSQTVSKAKSKDSEPRTQGPSQMLVAPSYDDESSSHTPMDMDDSSQSSFVIRLPPRQSEVKEGQNKETRRLSQHNIKDVQVKDGSKNVDVASSESTKCPSRKSSTRSSRRPSINVDELEERLSKKFDDKIAEVQALQSAHREFFEAKFEDLVHERTHSLKESLYHEMDELQWALLRSEEANRTLEANQIRLVAVIDEMQTQLQELRYELGYGATDKKLARGMRAKKGALCSELYPDHYARLNPPQGASWKRRESRHRASFGVWSKNPYEDCHRPAHIETEEKKRKDKGSHPPKTSGKVQLVEEPPKSSSPAEKTRSEPPSAPANKKRSRNETPPSEAGRHSKRSKLSGCSQTVGDGEGKAVKRPGQSIQSLCNDDSRQDPVMKQ